MSSAGNPDVLHWHNSDVALPREGQRVIFDGLRGDWLKGKFIGGKFVRDADYRKGEKTDQVCEFVPSHWRLEDVK